MNGLSWLIYVSDIIGSFEGFLLFLVIVTFGLTILTGILSLIHWKYIYSSSAYEVGKNKGDLVFDEPDRQRYLKYFKWLLPLFIFLSLLIIFIPQQRTILLIAGSELAESVVLDEKNIQIYDALRDKILDQLKDIEPNVSNSE